MSAENPYVVIDPTGELAAKAPVLASVDAQTLLARADTAVSGLSAELVASLRADIDRLDDAFATAANATGNRNRNQSAHGIAFELKGLGTTAGYPLVTAICESLCLLLRSLDAAGQRELEAIGLHIDLLRRAITRAPHEPEGEFDEQIARGLREADAAILERRPPAAREPGPAVNRE